MILECIPDYQNIEEWAALAEEFGMNFEYMPELQWRYSYVVVILVSAAILIGGIVWFRKKKWL